MKELQVFSGLGIQSPAVTPEAKNYRIPSWPPPNDFPVVIDALGNVVSRYGDPYWDLSPWSRTSLRVTFVATSRSKNGPLYSEVNANLYRQIAAWWLWGPNAAPTAITFKTRLDRIGSLFRLCSKKGISVAQISNHPLICTKYFSSLGNSRALHNLSIFHQLYECRDHLGFMIFGLEELRRLEASIPDDEHRQTPYIPPRIWLYQVSRLKEFIDDFITHKEQIKSCYLFCLDSYYKYYGSPAESFKPCKQRARSGNPFGLRKHKDAEYLGPFSVTAKRFGIYDLLRKWISPRKLLNHDDIPIFALSSYFSLTTRVGIAYILNFSLMRVHEAWGLPADCLNEEKDERFGKFYVIRGLTTKTIEDDDARWIVSPTVKPAIEALSLIARLRAETGKMNPAVPMTPEFLLTPHLATKNYEPWSPTINPSQDVSLTLNYPSYESLTSEYPKLFDVEKLRITDDDLNIARLITPTLDNDIFQVGRVWPLGWHQLRRTGAVNMQASGLVSVQSVQYQLKHLTLAQSLYYGQGYSRLHFNEKSRNEYIRTMYEVIALELNQLSSSRFFSPYGELRKSEILEPINTATATELSQAAKAGKVSWRETLAGGCTKRGPCPYGGIDNLVHCTGQGIKGPCVEFLVDTRKKPNLLRLKNVINDRLSDAASESPYRDALTAQLDSVEYVLKVIDEKGC